MSSLSRPGFHAISQATGKEMDCTDLAFTTNHPPDVPPRSRMVAVCGAIDVNNQADQSLDDTHTAAQIWLTCLDPQKLVAKYGEYAHGDPRKERRVVLDKDLLPNIERAGNLRVVHPKVLLDRFEKAVQEQAGYAKRDGQQLILLIFGHGKQANSGVYLGGEKGDDVNALLKIRELQTKIPTGTKVTLLLTSCFSGGWLVEPELGQRKRFNVTGIAASGPSDETRSWSLSGSASRACGSTIATAILNELIRVQEADDADDEPEAHPTYIDLATAIYERASKIDTFFPQQNAHFTAQDDHWESHWRARVGTPLTQFRVRWEELRQIPPSGTRLGGTISRPYYNRRFGSLEQDLVSAAKEYFDAVPGRDSLASNVSLHGGLAQVLIHHNPRYSDSKVLESLLEKVRYRLNAMKEADEHVKAMHLRYQSCLGYSPDDQFRPNAAVRARWEFARKYITQVKLFPEPVSEVWPASTKPTHYLAIVLAEKCHSEAEIRRKVDEALEWRAIRSQALLPCVQAYEVLNDAHIRTKLSAYFAALRHLGHGVYVKAGALTAGHQGYSAVPTNEIPTF